MATPLNVEFIKTTKSKNKAHKQGFLYTLKRVSTAGTHSWVCEKRATCKGRINTTPNVTVLIPTELSEILVSHSHAPDLLRAQMLQNYQSMKERARKRERKLEQYFHKEW